MGGGVTLGGRGWGGGSEVLAYKKLRRGIKKFYEKILKRHSASVGEMCFFQGSGWGGY